MIGDTCFWMIVVKDPLTNVGSWPGDFQILWKSFRPPLERGGQLKVYLCVIKYNHAGFPRLYRAFFRASRLAPKWKITATELDNTYNIYDKCWNATIRIDISVFRTWNMVISVFRWILRRFPNRMNWSSFIFVHQYHPKSTTVQKNIDQLQVFSFSELLRSELLSTVEHCLHASAWHCMDFGWQWQNPTSISWRSCLDPC